jgi:hypothetical protein
MVPEYQLSIGDVVLTPRDAVYVPAVAAQLDQFPGLVMTAHDVLVVGDRAAVYVTEHGAAGPSATDTGDEPQRQAAWAAIALYQWNGEHLTNCVAVEDYYARRRQLTREPLASDPIDAPAVAPWDTPNGERDALAEESVREWIEAGHTLFVGVDDAAFERAGPEIVVRRDDEHITGVALEFVVTSSEITDLFSSRIGDNDIRVAFHVIHEGRYMGGLDGVAANDRTVKLYAAGLLHLDPTHRRVISGRVVRDRNALRSALRSALSPSNR